MIKSLSLLVPAYNEEKLLTEAIEYYYHYLKKQKNLSSFEIIICVNGSTDNTGSVAKQLAKKHSEIKYLITNQKGVGIALKLGIKKAAKDIIAYMPGDGEFKAEFLGDALNAMDKNTMIIGSRRLGGEYKGKPLFRKFLSYGLNALTSIFLSKKVAESFSVKMYDANWAKKTAGKLKEKGFASQIELVYFALTDKLSIKEVPTGVLHKKDISQSSVKIINTIWSTFIITAKYGFKYKCNLLKNFLNF